MTSQAAHEGLIQISNMHAGSDKRFGTAQMCIFGDGSAKLTNVPSLYKDPTPFYAGSGAFWRDLRETGWNALNGR